MSRPVVLSHGMGVDTAALLTRWLDQPNSRDFDLADLVVITAMTGDEYDATREHMEEHLLPLMCEHQIRYVQVARAGKSNKDGIVVLDDSRAPQRMIMRGPWTLSDELRDNGLVPQIVTGARKCSMKFKGWVLDRWIRDNLDGQPYQHVIGFAAEETKRAARDTSYTRNSRDPEYPLMRWGWDRADCQLHLLDRFATIWPRSCCGYCPFAASKTGLPDLLQRWRREPAQAVRAMVLEHRALVLNPRSALFGSRTARQVALANGLRAEAAQAGADLARAEWAVYGVRRIYHPRAVKDPAAPGGRRVYPHTKGSAWRSVETLHLGSRAECEAMVRGRRGSETDQHGVVRHYTDRAGPPYPSRERMLAAGPAGIHDKARAGFAAAWSRLDQLALFGAAS